MITTSEYLQFLAFINALLIKTRFRGTILAGDIANRIFVAHPKMGLEGLKTFVKKTLNKEVNDEKTAKLNAKALQQLKAEAKNRVAEKKATDLEFKAKCNNVSNEWEKNKRKKDPKWRKKRNKKQRNRKRKKKKIEIICFHPPKNEKKCQNTHSKVEYSRCKVSYTHYLVSYTHY